MIKKIANVLSLFIIDLLAFYISLFVAFEIIEILSSITETVHAVSYQDITKLYWIPLLLILFFTTEGFYTDRNPFWEQARSITKALTVVTLFIFAIDSFLNLPYSFSRPLIVAFWLISLFIFPIFRFYGKSFLYKIGLWNEPVIILGVNERGKILAEELNKNKFLGYQVIGFLSYGNQDVGQQIKIKEYSFEILGKSQDYCQLAKQHKTKVVVISLFDIEAEKLSEIVAGIQKCARRVLVLPQNKGLAMQNTKLLHLFSKQTFLLEVNNNLKKSINKLTKKAFDVIAALIILPLLLPLLAIIAILIKLDSKGSIFFVQTRLGENNKDFQCIKFRTMHENADEMLKQYFLENPKAAEEYHTYKKLRSYDPRITKVGNFLRKTSLDELAQIFNVLKGEMSLVGPRPYLPKEKEEMGKYVNLILEAAPGITGLWQVSGRNELEFNERVKLDVWYVLNWSLWSDILILFKTIKVVLRREGAY